MTRDFLEMAVAQAERHVARGEVILARQRAAIAASERMGRNVGPSKEFLSVFEESQRLHVPIEIGCGEIWKMPRRHKGEKRPDHTKSVAD